MPKPNAFYYTPAQGQLQFTHTPTGVLDVNQLIIGKAPWIVPNPCKKKQKKIILADWTAANWSPNKIPAVQAALGELIDEGFLLYMEQTGEINPLLKIDLVNLKNKSFRELITVNYPEDIAQSAVSQHHLTRDEIFILDDYWLDYLLGTDEVKSRKLRFTDLTLALAQHHLNHINVLKKALPPLTTIIFDVFAGGIDEIIPIVRSKFPNVEIINQYKIAALSDDEIEELLNNQKIIFENSMLEKHQLKSISKLWVLGKLLKPAQLKDLLSAMPQCTALDFKRLINTDSMIEAIKNRLIDLEEMTLTYCDITAVGLQKLLLAAINITKLNLMGCKNWNEPFALPEKSLNHLEEINLSRTDITEQSLQVLLDAAPNVKILQLDNWQSATLNIKHDRLSNLVEMNLSESQITTAGLQQFLMKAPKLKKLNLSECHHLNETFRIKEGSLDQLKEIKIALSCITSASLKVLSIAAPNLKKLNLSEQISINANSSNRLNPLSLLDINLCRLNNLEEIELFGYQITSADLEMILKTAPKLKEINLFRASYCLDEVLKLEKNSLMHFKKINLGRNQISEANLQILMAAAPNLIFEPNQFSEDFFNGPKVQQPVDPVHDPANQKDFKPNSDQASFQYQGKNKTLNQAMFIDKFCHYLTLTQQHLESIPQLQDGICNALSHFFVTKTDSDWKTFIDEVVHWNGQLPLSDLLNKQFIELWDCIKKHQLLDCSQRWFIGAQVEALRELKNPCVLFNTWHAIAMKPGSQEDSWMLYDPNYINGAREVFGTESLKQEVYKAIGNLISLETPLPNKPFIPSFETFLEEGGLWVLIQCDNAQELLKQIPSHFDMPLTALDGLLLRNSKGIPAWVSGIKHSNKETSQLTHALLQQLMNKNPSYQQVLQKSMEILTPLERQECITQLIQCPPDVSSQEERTKLIHLIKTATPDYSAYEKRLETWIKPKARPMTSLEYCQHCIKKENTIKSCLIELDSTAQLHALRYALEHYAQNTQRPIFYIHSPDDLVYLKTTIKRDGNRGRLQKGQGGPFYDFLQRNQNKSPVVLVNYEQFQAEDLVRLNSLLENQSSMITMPPETLIIGLLNINKPNCYQGSDFYSRMDRVEMCPVSTEVLEQAIPQLPLAQKEGTKEGVAINLFHAPCWKERLLGSWELKDDGLHFKEGELAPALQTGKPLLIQNGLWQDEEFKRFWQEAYLRGTIHHAGRDLIIPKNLIIKKEEGYDWNILKANLHLSPEPFNCSPDAKTLNPNCLTPFFSRYEFLQSTLMSRPGFIEEHKNKDSHLNIYLTRPLGEEQWAMLLAECRQHGVQLQVHCAAGVKLPPMLGVLDARAANVKPWRGKVSSATQIITSTDVDTTVALLSKTNTWQVIDVSECKPTDLLMRIHATLNDEQLSFEFHQTKGALLHGLEEQNNILLKGHFSAELADQLAPLLLERNGTNASLGQLILVCEKASSFQYLPTESHTVTIEEKATCLGDLSPELTQQLTPFMAIEPLSTLLARRDFCNAHSAQSSSDENWQGLHDLPKLKQALAPLDSRTSVQESLEFTQKRRDSINKVLTNNPYVFIAGLSGVGKSTFVQQELCQGNDQLYQGEHCLKEWAANTSTAKGRKLLFLDEATLSARNWSEFEGLFENPPGILIEGTYYPLTKEHQVIFAGNPVSYGDERQLATLFQRHGKTIIFDPLPTAVLYEKILKPVFAQTNVKELAAANAAAHFLNVYRFLVDIATTDVLISPRELQMMALLTVSYCQRNPKANALMAAQHYAFALAKHLVPETHLLAFDTQFKPQKPLQRPQPTTGNDFLLTPSRINRAQHLEDVLALRQLRQEGVFTNEAQKYGGLGGIIFEGEPGIGKTELVMNTLQTRGFKKVTDFSKPESVENPFYHLPAGLSITDKEELLLKAFDEGAVVVIDEINSSPRMERLLNNLLMGKKPATLSTGVQPNNPGFMVIGTQNPVTMAGRRAPSTALSRRLTTYTLPLYTDEEMQDILRKKGMAADNAISIIALYNKNVAYARQNKLSPAPTFRDVLRLADEISKANNRLSQAYTVEIHLDSNENALVINQKCNKEEPFVKAVPKKKDIDIVREAQMKQVRLSIHKMQEKIEKLRNNGKDTDASKAAEMLCNQLTDFANEYVTKDIDLDEFKSKTNSAVDTARKELDKPRGYCVKHILANLSFALMTLGIGYIAYASYQGTFFPIQPNTDSTNKAEDLRESVSAIRSYPH